MDLSSRELTYLAILVGLLLLFQRLRGSFVLFSLLILPGTFCHELCHLCVGTPLGGRPKHFTILPKREGHGYVMGSVTFTNVRWYNAFFLGMAPLLLLPVAYGLWVWRLSGPSTLNQSEGLALYLIANLIYASLPSCQDFKIAARSPIGWLLLLATAALSWYRFHSPRPLEQVKVSRLTNPHASLRDPGTSIGLGQAHEIG